MGMCRSTWTRRFLRDGVFLVSFLTCFPTTLLLCFQTILASFILLFLISVFRFLFLVPCCSLFPFGTNVAIMSENFTLHPVHGFKPKLQASASYAKYELCFGSSWDMHSAVPCAALTSRDVLHPTSLLQLSTPAQTQNQSQTPISKHQTTPPDLPTSLSFLALHFSPPTQNTSQDTIHIAFAFTFTFTSAIAIAIVFLHFQPCAKQSLSRVQAERKGAVR